jgi:protein subunit release factor B
MSQISTNQTTPESSNKWGEIAGQIIDKVIGKNMSMTYDFQQLTIDMPRAEGPGGKHVGSAQWTINGRIVITSEVHDKKINQ